MAIDLSKYKDLFVSETEDHIQKLNDNILAFEKNPADKKLLDELMRSSHTIKGASFTMGFKNMAFLTHMMEDIFDFARNGMLKVTPKIIQELFRTIDLLEKSLKSIKKNNQEVDVDSQSRKLKELTGIATEGMGKSMRDAIGKPLAQNKNSKNKETTTQIETKKIIKDKDKNIEDIENVEKIAHIKVPVERLDGLMDLIEELLIDKMRLEQFVKKQKDIKIQELTELKSLADHLSRLVSDIQYQVMEARLVPVEQIFARFPRMVRDLAQSQNKKIDLQISGGDIEFDRTIIDKLAEPLVHLLRNAIDHGISKQGIIKLEVRREKEYALIIVENNGNSIDFEKIRQAAVKRNIVGAKEAEAMDKKQLINLLYQGRLSTKEKVTETSGRGIGLSVVKEFVAQLGGRVDIESPIFKEGGARFTLELPLSLAIINALLVGVGDNIFAIPFSSIERSISMTADNIKSMADQDMVIVDKTEVPLVRLNKVFKIADSKKQNRKFEIVVLVKRGRDIAGIVVDGLINQQEIIVRPLPGVMKKIKGFSGLTILGDGRTVLIIDAVSLLEDTKRLIRTT